MRGMLIVAGMLWLGVHAPAADAEEKRSTSERILGGVVSGLLGEQPQSPNAVYSAQERDRLVSMLQSGQYVTSRQGEPIDVVIYGVPLTRAEHVYTARPIPPSATSDQQSQP